MNSAPVISRDERTLAVEKDGIVWAYCFLTYALLFDVMYRGFVYNEAAWDLLGMVIVGGIICTLYQYRQKALNKYWLSKPMIIVLIGTGVLSAILAVIITMVTH